MKKLAIITYTVISVIYFGSCTNNSTKQQVPLSINESTDSAKISGIPCNVTISGIHFTKSINDAVSNISINDNKITFTSGKETDYFSDPNGKLSNTTAPLLLTSIDNSKPFTFTAKVTPRFTEDGTYNAGVLYVYVNDSFFQKHCFEQDERGKHRVVTVRTEGTSDDSNHDIVEQGYVYMKISSDTRTIASYYSLDNKNWQMVRLYKNNYPAEIWLGISNQCPMREGSQSSFEELNLELKSVSDFRMGI